MLFCSVTSAAAQVSIGIGHPSVSIGINLPLYPELVRVPGYPVYYAPRLNSNVFFYDGLYWVYQDDNWYASSWYNGPWGLVASEGVPLFVLRIPVRYYRQPPAYFSGWRLDAPPRWGEHWGNEWEQQRSGWERWNRSSAPAPAPLPVYQRQYSGDRYPRVEQQQALHSQEYRYQPRDAVVRQYYQEQAVQRAPASAQQKQQGAQSAKAFAPGQVKKEQGAQSAKAFAPGQVKKEQGVQSAKAFAPGQVKKEQGAQSAKEFAPGQQMKEQGALGTSSKPKDAGKGKGRGKDEERGRKRDK
jgi:hypothetical protein